MPKGDDGAASPSFVVTGLPSLASSRSPHRLLPPPSLLCVSGEQLHGAPNPNHSACSGPIPCAPTPVAARQGTVVAALALGAHPWRRGMAVKQPRGRWICVGDAAEACRCGVMVEAMIGSCEALQTAAYMEAGAPPRGEQVRLLWLVCVKGLDAAASCSLTCRSSAPSIALPHSDCR
ncbi:unnamed protein product [Urochloa humidicola]